MNSVRFSFLLLLTSKKISHTQFQFEFDSDNTDNILTRIRESSNPIDRLLFRYFVTVFVTENEFSHILVDFCAYIRIISIRFMFHVFCSVDRIQRSCAQQKVNDTQCQKYNNMTRSRKIDGFLPRFVLCVTVGRLILNSIARTLNFHCFAFLALFVWFDFILSFSISVGLLFCCELCTNDRGAVHEKKHRKREKMSLIMFWRRKLLFQLCFPFGLAIFFLWFFYPVAVHLSHLDVVVIFLPFSDYHWFESYSRTWFSFNVKKFQNHTLYWNFVRKIHDKLCWDFCFLFFSRFF